MTTASGLYARIARIVLCVFLYAGIAYAQNDAPLSDSSPSPSPSTEASPDSTLPRALQIVVEGLRNEKGHVTCSLFNDPKAFPRGEEFREARAPIHGDAAICEFTDIPAGKYAVVVYHDENGNGHFDQNAFGMPLEGYGFSKNAAPLFDAPSFAAASLDYDGQHLFTVINIRY